MKIKTTGVLFKLLICFIIFGLTLPCRSFAITVAKEEKLSRKFLKIVRKHFEIIDDYFIVDYLNRTGKKILSAFPEKTFNYKFYAIKKDSYNAFAIPAGHIFINSGLIGGMETEEELAGILAHEIAHVYCRHISQRIERGKKVSLLTTAGLLAGIFLGAGIGETATQAMLAGSMATGHSMMLSHSREHEMQADQVGLKYLLKSGYSGEGLLVILKKMRNKRWFGPDHIPVYLTTHPAVENRMAYLETQIKTSDRVKPQTEQYDFQMAKARAIALYGDTRVALNKFKKDIRSNPEDSIANYGYGLALIRVGQIRDGETFLIKALERKAFDANILIDLGRAYYLRGKYRDAIKTIKGALIIDSGNMAGLFFLGSAHMELKNYDEAISSIQSVFIEDPHYKNVAYLLGKIYGKKKDMKNAHYYLGVYHKNKEEWKTAAFHLRRALDKTVEASRKNEIEKMLKDVKKKGREEDKKMEEEAKDKR